MGCLLGTDVAFCRIEDDIFVRDGEIENDIIGRGTFAIAYFDIDKGRPFLIWGPCDGHIFLGIERMVNGINQCTVFSSDVEIGFRNRTVGVQCHLVEFRIELTQVDIQLEVGDRGELVICFGLNLSARLCHADDINGALVQAGRLRPLETDGLTGRNPGKSLNDRFIAAI